MNYLKSKEFDIFILKEINKKYKSKEKRDLEKEVIKQTGTREYILAKTFFDIIKQIKLNIDEVSHLLLHIPKDLPKLELFPENENKLYSFVNTYAKELKEISDSTGIKYNRFIKLYNGDYNNLYPDEVNGLAIAFNLKPSQLFEYLYGDGERPIIGLLPKPAEGKESEG